MEDQAWVLVLQEEYSDPRKMVSQAPRVLSEEPWADPVQDLQGAVVGAWCPLLVPQHLCSGAWTDFKKAQSHCPGAPWRRCADTVAR